MNASKAKTLFCDAVSELQAIVEQGFNDYSSKYGDTAHAHHPRTRACLIHDHIVARAKQSAPQIAGFVFIGSRPRNFFEFREAALIQFKKLDRRLLTSNVQTQLSLALEECSALLTLPGIPPKLPLVTIGYVPNIFFTGVDGVFITYVENRKLKWHIPLVAEEDQLRMPDEDEQSKQSRKRVHAKGKRKPTADGRDAQAV